MTSPRVRRRLVSRLYSVEDEVLDKVSQEAEARLNARNQARAEAREIRLRELEKQQEAEPQYNDYSDDVVYPRETKRKYETDTKSTREPFHSPHRIVEDDSENIGSKEYKLLMNQLTEVEEKFRKAMVNVAQLDNEKNAFSYEVDTLKDEFEEIEEKHFLLQKDLKTVTRDYDFLKRDYKDLQDENTFLKGRLEQCEKLISDCGLEIVGGEKNTDVNDNEEGIPNGLEIFGNTSDISFISKEASEILKKAGQGNLDTQLKKLAKEKQECLDELYMLRLDYEEEKQKLYKMEQFSLIHSDSKSPEIKLIEIQREANKQVTDYKYRLKKAEQDITAMQSNISKLENQLNKFKNQAETSENAMDELKGEKRKFQRELKDAQAKIEDLEIANSHLEKRINKLKATKDLLNKTYY